MSKQNWTKSSTRTRCSVSVLLYYYTTYHADVRMSLSVKRATSRCCSSRFKTDSPLRSPQSTFYPESGLPAANTFLGTTGMRASPAIHQTRFDKNINDILGKVRESWGILLLLYWERHKRQTVWKYDAIKQRCSLHHNPTCGCFRANELSRRRAANFYSTHPLHNTIAWEKNDLRPTAHSPPGHETTTQAWL